MRRLVVLAVLATDAAGSAGAGPTTPLRLHGIGPLQLGMTRTAALAPGWLAGRGRGCPLGGPPVPITYGFTGPRAPAGLKGFAEFDGGRLRVMSFTAGVHTAAGVTVGQTTSARMVSRYRSSGFSARARFDHTFGGTFVSVTRGTDQLIGAFATNGAISELAIPDVPVCE
ncbi:MAG: hypothetical protein ACR2KV_10615 [Solirubrobacteraceae bacterium]